MTRRAGYLYSCRRFSIERRRSTEGTEEAAVAGEVADWAGPSRLPRRRAAFTFLRDRRTLSALLILLLVISRSVNGARTPEAK